jgi:hypothetical protein
MNVTCGAAALVAACRFCRVTIAVAHLRRYLRSRTGIDIRSERDHPVKYRARAPTSSTVSA